jgi:hypothetical protein
LDPELSGGLVVLPRKLRPFVEEKASRNGLSEILQESGLRRHLLRIGVNANGSSKDGVRLPHSIGEGRWAGLQNTAGLNR